MKLKYSKINSILNINRHYEYKIINYDFMKALNGLKCFIYWIFTIKMIHFFKFQFNLITNSEH